MDDVKHYSRSLSLASHGKGLGGREDWEERLAGEASLRPSFFLPSPLTTDRVNTRPTSMSTWQHGCELFIMETALRSYLLLVTGFENLKGVIASW